MRQENQIMKKKLGLCAVMVLLGVGLMSDVLAQSSTTGNITGAVRDPQGAAVPKAEITIEEENTGASRTVTADDDGFYSAPSLPVGRYTLSTSPQGFKKTVATGVVLHVSENKVVNLDLQVGQVTETVTITSETSPVETRSGEISSLIAEKQVTELPLNGRNFTQLVLMVPGVSPSEYNFAARGTGLDAKVDLSVNGNGSNTNMWTVDGVNNMDVGSNTTLLVFPSIDSIQEFRVQRNSFSAEFGQAQGAVINLITKGGANEFHGTVFEFLRNDKLNANDFFLNRNTDPNNLDSSGKAKRPPLRYNNFGGNFSGPIIKNRIFFFWSEEWRRESRSRVVRGKVPTAAEKLGDFSGVLTDALPHDPFTGLPFPGNRIPQSMLSPAGLAILRLYPDANDLTNPTGLNWINAVPSSTKTRQDLIRGDVTITSNMNLMVRWINEKWDRPSAGNTFWGDDPFPTLESDWSQPSNSLAVKLTNTLSSTAVNEFQFSRSGNDIFITTNPAGDTLLSEINSRFPTVFPRTEGAAHPTLWAASGYDTLWHQAPWQNHEDLFIWKDDFSKVVGSHDLKMGVLFSHNIKNEEAIGSNELAQWCGTNTRTGNAIADLLVRDLPVGCYSEADHQENVLGRWHDTEAYFNDTWKFSKRVTLNLGVRWSRYGQPFSKNDRISNFIPRLYDGTDPASGLVNPGEQGFNRALTANHNLDFQPRVGIAWDIKGDGKTALRLGAGRYLSRSNVTNVLLMGVNPPWTKSVAFGWGGGSTSLGDDPTSRSLDTISPGLANASVGINASTNLNAVDEDFRPPESWQWNLTLSREILPNTVVEASYVGNRGLHLWRRVNWNEVVPSARLTVAEAVLSGNPDANAIINANRRLVGVGRIRMSESTGNSFYHGLQIWLNRRFSNRLAFQAAYTWSHNISDVPVQSYAAFDIATSDAFNYRQDRGDADLDRRHTFVANAVYALPSFKNLGTIGSAILGDWQLNGIASFFTGTPLNVLSGANSAGLVIAGGQRPNLVPGVPIYLDDPNRPLQYLNPAAFALPAPGQPGNLGAGVIRRPGISNIDFSINKNWRMRERFNIQFRAEMFNVFNHPNFAISANDDPGENRLSFGQLMGDPNFGVPTNGSFGQLTRTRGSREIQFGLKFSF